MDLNDRVDCLETGEVYQCLVIYWTVNLHAHYIIIFVCHFLSFELVCDNYNNHATWNMK